MIEFFQLGSDLKFDSDAVMIGVQLYALPPIQMANTYIKAFIGKIPDFDIILQV